MFIVVGHAVAYYNGTEEGSKPYVGPVSTTKEGAIESWRLVAHTNDQDSLLEQEIDTAASNLLDFDTDTLVVLNEEDDEYVICLELEEE